MTHRHPSGTSILRKSGLLAIATAFSVSGQFLLIWYMARFRGPAFLGAYGVIITMVDIARVIYSSGAQPLILRKASRRPALPGVLVGTALGGGISLNLLAAVLIIAAAFFFSQTPDAFSATLVAALAVIPEGVRITGELVAIGTGREHYVTGMSFLLAIVQTIAVAGVLIGGGQLLHIFGAIALSASLCAATYLGLLNRWTQAGRVRTNPRLLATWNRLWRPFFWTGVFSTASYRLDLPILTQISGLEAGGLYTAALKTVKPLMLMRAALFQGFFPSFVRRFDENPGDSLNLLRSAIRLSSFVFAATALVAVGAADAVVEWLYGPAFAPTAPAVQVMLWGLPAFYAYTLIVSVLFAKGLEKTALYIQGVNFAVEIALSLALVPFWGVMGMAIVYSFTRILGLAQLWLSLRKRRVEIGLSRTFLSPVLVAAAMSVPLFLLTRQVPPLAQVALGGVGGLLYGALGFVVGLIRPQDFAPLLRLLRRRRGHGTPLGETR
jgi:O-antigen/teichoic acid export membrane protein